jgi:hypothetical protein
MWVIPSFIYDQYGKLNKQSKPVKSVISALNAVGISINDNGDIMLQNNYKNTKNDEKADSDDKVKLLPNSNLTLSKQLPNSYLTVSLELPNSSNADHDCKVEQLPNSKVTLTEQLPNSKVTVSKQLNFVDHDKIPVNSSIKPDQLGAILIKNNINTSTSKEKDKEYRSSTRSSTRKEKEEDKKLTSRINTILDIYYSTLDGKLLDSMKKHNDNFIKVCKMLIVNDLYDDNDVIEAIKWARNDDFWSHNFHSFSKLRSKNPEGITYIDVFLEKLEKKPRNNQSKLVQGSNSQQMFDFCRENGLEYSVVNR